MKHSFIIQLFVCCLLALFVCCSYHGERHEVHAPHVRVARNDQVPADLEVLVSQFRQRLDALEADNQALRTELENVREKNEVLEGTVAELQRGASEHPAGGTPTGAASGTPPGGTPSASVTGSSVSAGLERMKSEMETLREKGAEVESQLQGLLNETQALQNSSRDLDQLRHEVHGVNMKFQLLEQILAEVKQESHDVHTNVTGLQASSQFLLQQLLSVTQILTSHNVSNGVAAPQSQSQPGSTVVAFHAKAGPSEVEVSGESTVTLKFPVTLTNEGQAYNSATGKATAPVGGVYLFLASVATSGHESAKLSLVVNGHGVTAVTRAHGHEAGEHQVASLQAVVKLNPGDTVWVKVVAGGPHHEHVGVRGGAETTFSGLLLH